MIADALKLTTIITACLCLPYGMAILLHALGV